MRRVYLVVSFILVSIAGFAQSSTLKRPKLVVGIAVDQMRWDFLYRYYNRYTNEGFKRMLNEGFSCENTFIDYIPSVTGIGHASIFTGSVPAIHGIAGNEWIDQSTGKTVYCTDDAAVKGVGSDNAAGKMSPKNLLATTITDELRMATNFQSKVVGISLKDRASILPAGHNPTAAFWFDDQTGNFITSTWYMNDLPGWAKSFNEKDVPQQLIDKPWNTLYPINTYTQSTSDDVLWEGKYTGETTTSFPHDLGKLYKNDRDLIRVSPFGNTLTLEFAKAAIEGYKLGQNSATDFLTVNCASTDYVGHKFGPNSIEVEDVYYRLDKDLGAFFKYLDQKIGKGNYTVFLTADHGAAHSIGFMQANKMPADFLESTVYADLNTTLKDIFGEDKLLLPATNYQLNFDNKKIADKKLDFDRLKETAINFLKDKPGVQYVVDMSEIGEAPIPAKLKEMMINGYNVKRSGVIQIIPDPGWFGGKKGGTGTTHGTWNPHDTHIPLVWMGWGIRQGKSNREVYITDIAPTVAALLRIQTPNGSIGRAIEEVIK